jgi:hypothetical protein
MTNNQIELISAIEETLKEFKLNPTVDLIEELEAWVAVLKSTKQNQMTNAQSALNQFFSAKY